jgi:glycosyltransferase involved in cell wall biosynthesis
MTRRVAIVHDALVNAGGAERVLTFMCEAFPDAPVFTSAYLPDRTYDDFRTRDIRVLPGASQVRDERDAKRRFPMWVAGFRRLDLRGFDAVLSSTTFAAKHIRTPAGIPHACYCYAPFRLLWRPDEYTASSVPGGRAATLGLSLLFPALRRWDRAAMRRPDVVATTCRNMAKAIRECYDREARIIYAPVRLSEYEVGGADGGYYLTVSRLVSHKHVELAIEACRRLGRRLIVVGDGPELPRLRAAAGQETTFAGFVDRRELARLYTDCRALLFCSHEDYGLAPLEAQASGRPVIAYGAGGALETIVAGETGLFFGEQRVEALIEAVEKFEAMSFDPVVIRAAAARFDTASFTEQLRAFVLSAESGERDGGTEWT